LNTNQQECKALLYQRLIKWFQPEPAETKQSAAAPLIAFSAHGQPVWTPRDYAALAKEGFMRNPVAYRCVRMIAEAAASIPFTLHEEASEHDTHPLLDLLKEPNPVNSGTEFFEDWYSYLQIAGNAYFEAVLLDNEVRELYVLRPDRVKVIPGPEGWPSAYEYSAGGRSIRFAQDSQNTISPIYHMALFHPNSDHYGLSPLEAAACAIDIHNSAGAWNKALLDNSARPSGALVYEGKGGNNNLSEDQFARLKAELESAFQGMENAGRPMLLEGGLDWKSMGYSPREMDFIDAKHTAARDIALAFGVPPMLLGIPGDNTYSNYAEANRNFWRQTILPLVAKTASALTNWVGPAFGANLRLGFNPDRVEALSHEREALWKRIGAADFLTPDEKRAAIGYGPLEDQTVK